MNCTVEYDEGSGIVVVTYNGRCSGKDFRDATHKRVAIAEKEDSTKTLIDATNLECSSSTTFDVYDIVSREYPSLGSRSEWKMAITTPKSAEAQKQVHFFENACVNRGWRVRQFASRKDAIDWLAID